MVRKLKKALTDSPVLGYLPLARQRRAGVVENPSVEDALAFVHPEEKSELSLADHAHSPSPHSRDETVTRDHGWSLAVSALGSA